MPKTAQIPPEKFTTNIGSVNDLRRFLDNLKPDVQGLEELYEANLYHDHQTDEKWLEITPVK